MIVYLTIMTPTMQAARMMCYTVLAASVPLHAWSQHTVWLLCAVLPPNC